MKLQVKNNVLDIQDEYVKFSPYLSTLLNTNVKTDKLGEIYKLYDVELQDILKYLDYLRGNITQTSEYLLNYMGHENPLGYPIEYFNYKLHDNWIRDNFHNTDYILEVPFYDLEEIYPISSRVEEVLNYYGSYFDGTKNMYIAGGSAMYYRRF